MWEKRLKGDSTHSGLNHGKDGVSRSVGSPGVQLGPFALRRSFGTQVMLVRRPWEIPAWSWGAGCKPEMSLVSLIHRRTVSPWDCVRPPRDRRLTQKGRGPSGGLGHSTGTFGKQRSQQRRPRGWKEGQKCQDEWGGPGKKYQCWKWNANSWGLRRVWELSRELICLRHT